LDSLKKVARASPRRELRIVLDDYHTHKHPEINAWLAENPRITLHFTPTSGSWMNLVEVFGIITRQAIRRDTFASVEELVAAIRRFIDGWNEPCHPFTWTKTGDGSCRTRSRSELETRDTRTTGLRGCGGRRPPPTWRNRAEGRPAREGRVPSAAGEQQASRGGPA
jgi:hypothetical protein